MRIGVAVREGVEKLSVRFAGWRNWRGFLSSLVLGVVLVVSVASCRGDGDGFFSWTIATMVEIDAPPERVWEVLIDLPQYREWNPFIVEASGVVAVGEWLDLRMALPGRDPVTITPQVLVAEPQRELRWKGRLLMRGLFDGEHAFLLTALEGGRTRLDHVEHFGGLLMPIAKRMIHEGTVQAFHAMDSALAERAARAPS